MMRIEKLVAVTSLALCLSLPAAARDKHPRQHHKHPVAHAIGHVLFEIAMVPLYPVFYLIDLGGASL